MDRVYVRKKGLAGADLEALTTELQDDWVRRRRQGFRGPSWQYGDVGDQAPLLTRRVPRGAQFLGRVVLNGALPFAEEKLHGQAHDLGLPYFPVRRPLGLRYLPYSALQASKTYSNASRAGEDMSNVSNPRARVIEKFDDILDGALRDVEFDAISATQQVKVWAGGICTREYRDERGNSVVVGASLATSIDPWEHPTTLRTEREYFMRTYDPDVIPYWKLGKSVFIPLGWIAGAEGSDPRLDTLIESQLATIQRAAVYLGPVGLTDEVGWDQV